MIANVDTCCPLWGSCPLERSYRNMPYLVIAAFWNASNIAGEKEVFSFVLNVSLFTLTFIVLPRVQHSKSCFHSVKSVDLYNIKLCSYIPSPILRCFLSTTDSSLWYKDLIAKLPHTAHCMFSSWSRSPLFWETVTQQLAGLAETDF